MKTFDQIFQYLTPYMEYLIYVDGDEVRVGQRYHKCGICDNQTRFYSISFAAPYCSIKCLNQEWNNYWKATSRKEGEDDKAPTDQQS